jgi:putative NADH-flavin reductase
MRIAIFGSTGPTGRLLVTQALQDGYRVCAFARDPRRLGDFEDERLSVIPGELSDGAAVGRAITGADAVISVLGPTRTVTDTQLSDGVRSIIEAMGQHGVKRLVVLSTGSVTDPEDHVDLTRQFLAWMIKTTVRGAYDEILRIGQIVRASKTDWTLVRVGFLNNKPPAPLRVGHYGRGEVRFGISRASVARFMLDRVSRADYVHESPAISD